MQPQIDRIFESTRVVVSHTKTSLKTAIVKAVVENALPFRVFSTESFQLLFGEMAEKLKVSLDKDQIRHYVIEAARMERERLQKELKGSYFYLKFDCATRIRVNYLAVNIRSGLYIILCKNLFFFLQL